MRTGIFPVLFFCSLVARTVGAQGIVRSWLPWRTIETRHFVFHYPVELEAWTQALASRADAIDSSVARIVGYAPRAKTEVVVDDPYDLPNGSAWPFLDRPVINLWASPPDPRLDIGEFRDWGRTLLSHEFTHIAHLSRPSRNPMFDLLARLAPAQLGPITLNAPRWMFEGYATYAEGRVTGSGRPHGAWRPAYLRQWALEGQLPRYEQLNDFGSFDGGEFAYLAGSAFIEWLAQRHGDSSLVDVWRRMSARQARGFDEAFAGVYGESARSLYGRFTADLTGKSIEIARGLRAAFPRDTGDIVQRLSWSTGDPAISRDGRRVAISLASPTVPARVVIWSTAAEPDTARAKRDSLLLAKDPADVPARSIFPPPKRALATLRVTSGQPYESPRFLPDGRILLSRLVRAGDGSLSPDLHIWDPQRKHVDRVTHGAALRQADPAPDGRTALAMQCIHGWCDIAEVDLATGRDSIVLRGSPSRSFFRPRISPDGRRFLVSANENGRWQVIVVERGADRGAERVLPFPGNAYDASWLGNGVVVATADGDGIPNLYVTTLDAGGLRRLTAVTGAAVAAEGAPRDSSIWFLSLYSRGYDLRRVQSAARGDTSSVALDPRLVPAAMEPPAAVAELPENPVSAPRPFALGARLFRWLPLPQADADGVSAVLALSSTDVIGRSDVLARVAGGDRAAWRGASLELTWRGFRPFARANVFAATQALSGSRSRVTGAAPTPADVTLRGAFAALEGSRSYEGWSARYRLAASAASVPSASTSRSLAVADAGLAWLQRIDRSGFNESLAASVTVGNAFDRRFYRAVGSAGGGVFGFTPVPISASATYARTGDDAPAFERIALGGGAPMLLDRVLLTQQVAMPVLPAGIAVGSSAFAYRISLNTRPLNAYFWSGAAADSGQTFSRWHRVIGLEGSQAVTAIPVAGVPSARIVYGIGESLDAPFRKQARAYLSVVLNP